MPLHDWSRVESGIFHDVHTAWITEIRNKLNAGLLPENYYALAEQHAGDYIADTLALHVPPTPEELSPPVFAGDETGGGTALAEAPPRISQHEKIELDIIEIQRFLSIRHLSSHRVVALLEIVSPGNKNNQARYETFVHKTVDAVRRRVNVLMCMRLAVLIMTESTPVFATCCHRIRHRLLINLAVQHWRHIVPTRLALSISTSNTSHPKCRCRTCRSF